MIPTSETTPEKSNEIANEPRRISVKKSALMPPKQFVIGGKIWAHYNVRCPSCSKLYRVESKELASHKPHFECQACRTVFSFENPPQNMNKIECKIVVRTKPEQISEIAARRHAANFKRCPKCTGLSPRLATDCVHCHIIFTKLVRGGGSVLGRAWKDLMQDYQNIGKHIAFVDRCEDLQALPFALRKYQDLQTAQPQDSVTQDMIHQVWLRGLSKKMQASDWFRQSKVFAQSVNWNRVLKMSPWLMGALFIGLGLLKYSLRNLVGIGVAILFLCLGLVLFKRGKVELSDFY